MLCTEKFGALIALSLEGKGRKGEAGSYRIHGKHQSPERSWRRCVEGPVYFQRMILSQGARLYSCAMDRDVCEAWLMWVRRDLRFSLEHWTLVHKHEHTLPGCSEMGDSLKVRKKENAG